MPGVGLVIREISIEKTKTILHKLNVCYVSVNYAIEYIRMGPVQHLTLEALFFI